MKRSKSRSKLWIGAALVGLAALAVPRSAAAGEPWVYGEPRAGFTCTFHRNSDCETYGTVGGAVGIGYSGALAILRFGIAAEASIAGLFNGDGAGLTATAAGIGFGGFELGVINIDLAAGVGVGALALPESSVGDLYWTGRLRVTGRIDMPQSYVTIGGVAAANFFDLGEYTAAGGTLGLEIAYSWEQHEGGWYFMN
ncbi:MAG: hypothetical protein U0271_42760 [Polyangiaceae bacterium]